MAGRRRIGYNRTCKPPGQGQKPLLHLLISLPRQHQREQDVVLNGEGVQEVEILEHEPQVVPAEGGDVTLLDGDDVLPTSPPALWTARPPTAC